MGPNIALTFTTDTREARHLSGRTTKGTIPMAAMKPRTGDGPMEVTKEGRSLIMRVPIDGGGRLVLEINAEEAQSLKECLVGVTEATS